MGELLSLIPVIQVFQDGVRQTHEYMRDKLKQLTLTLRHTESVPFLLCELAGIALAQFTVTLMCLYIVSR